MSPAITWLLLLQAVPSTPMPTLTPIESSSCLTGAMPAHTTAGQLCTLGVVCVQVTVHASSVLGFCLLKALTLVARCMPQACQMLLKRFLPCPLAKLSGLVKLCCYLCHCSLN